MPGVVVDDGDAWVRVGLVRVASAAEPDDRRIDFNRVHVLDAVAERRGDVRPRTGAENQRVLEGVAEHAVGPLVEVFLLFDRGHRLVEDIVPLYDRVRTRLADRDLVV